MILATSTRQRLFCAALTVLLLGLFGLGTGPARGLGAGRTASSDEKVPMMPGDVFSVLTYNIHAGRDAGGRPSLDRLAAVINASGAAVVALQEVDRYTLRSRFVDQLGYLARTGDWEYAAGENLFLPPGSYGNALLSQEPLIAVQNQRLPSRREPRGFLRVVTEAGGYEVTVYVTHLGLDAEERWRHAQELAAALDGESGPVILLGDFNAAPDSPELEPLRARLSDAAEAVGHTRPTFPAGAATVRIDCVFVSEHFEVVSARVLDDTASDHHPLLVELRWREGAS